MRHAIRSNSGHAKRQIRLLSSHSYRSYRITENYGQRHCKSVLRCCTRSKSGCISVMVSSFAVLVMTTIETLPLAGTNAKSRLRAYMVLVTESSIPKLTLLPMSNNTALSLRQVYLLDLAKLQRVHRADHPRVFTPINHEKAGSQSIVMVLRRITASPMLQLALEYGGV